MDPRTTSLLALFTEGRTRFTKLLDTLTAADLPKRLAPSPNSIGFLVRHIGDVELLFAKNVFGLKDVQVHASTVAKGHDTGEWTDLAALKAYVQESADTLRRAIEALPRQAGTPDADWDTVIETKEFGRKTKAEALGRIVTHTAYHDGQIGMVLKYGQ
ncbi:MAG TPA: DinB family protein [Flavobacteriales bacterium]|nr:DinB family protein [Flavobacteriales bacterium]HMR28688.1 DinB family protein [Flavobacteriales bacterium]